MKPFSKSSESKSLSQAKEDFALRSIFSVMYGVGITVTNADEAMQAIDLAAQLMSIALGRKVKPSQVKARMRVLLEEWMRETSTKH